MYSCHIGIWYLYPLLHPIHRFYMDESNWKSEEKLRVHDEEAGRVPVEAWGSQDYTNMERWWFSDSTRSRYWRRGTHSSPWGKASNLPSQWSTSEEKLCAQQSLLALWLSRRPTCSTHPTWHLRRCFQAPTCGPTPMGGARGTLQVPPGQGKYMPGGNAVQKTSWREGLTS